MNNDSPHTSAHRIVYAVGFFVASLANVIAGAMIILLMLFAMAWDADPISWQEVMCIAIGSVLLCSAVYFFVKFIAAARGKL